MVDLEKLAETIRDHLRKELSREPTEKEVCARLPVILCKFDTQVSVNGQARRR